MTRERKIAVAERAEARSDARDIYLALWRAIDRPRPRTIWHDEPAILESFCRHSPPDDPEFPAPRTETELDSLVRDFPRGQRVICALTAAELVAHFWHYWRLDRATDETTAVPETLNLAYRWLGDRSPTFDELEAAFNRAWESANDADTTGDDAADYAATSVANVAWAAQSATGEPNQGLYWAVKQAINAITTARPDDETESATEQFLARWWMRCRCRLAFANPLGADLE